MNAWERWVRTAPEEMTSSLAIVPLPDIPALPEPLRGRHVVHIRIAYTGGADSGEELVEPLRAIGPRLMEGLREMPYTESGSICNDPTDPMPYLRFTFAGAGHPMSQCICRSSTSALSATLWAAGSCHVGNRSPTTTHRSESPY